MSESPVSVQIRELQQRYNNEKEHSLAKTKQTLALVDSLLQQLALEVTKENQHQLGPGLMFKFDLHAKIDSIHEEIAQLKAQNIKLQEKEQRLERGLKELAIEEKLLEEEYMSLTDQRDLLSALRKTETDEHSSSDDDSDPTFNASLVVKEVDEKESEDSCEGGATKNIEICAKEEKKTVKPTRRKSKVVVSRNVDSPKSPRDKKMARSKTNVPVEHSHSHPKRTLTHAEHSSPSSLPMSRTKKEPDSELKTKPASASEGAFTSLSERKENQVAAVSASITQERDDKRKSCEPNIDRRTSREKDNSLSGSKKEAANSMSLATDSNDSDLDVLDIISGLEVTINQRKWNDDMLLPDDYGYWYQFKVKRKGRPLLKFKDFAPKVFHQIRKHYGVDDNQFLESFNINNLNIIKGEGKSGAFFIFTKDKKFILKTALDSERDFLWLWLPYYWQYIRCNPNSMLPHFYGVYSMKHEGIGGVTRFIIMNNLFRTDPIERFDLKGSTLGRETPVNKRKVGVVLKDKDIKQENRKLYLDGNLRKAFVEIIKKDSAFLAEHNIMDYSLLIGICPKDEKEKSPLANSISEDRGRIFYADDEGACGYRPDGSFERYYIGIIDVLIQFGGIKKAESLFKSVFGDLSGKGEEASVVHPDYYAQRFSEFMIGLLPDDIKDDEVLDLSVVSSSSQILSKLDGSVKSVYDESSKI